MLNTPGQDDEDGELDLDFEGLVDDADEDDCLPLDDDRRQVGFELPDWTAAMLDTLDDELHARSLPHEWVSDGFEVVVHEDDEDTVDRLVAELVAPFVGGPADDDEDGGVPSALVVEDAPAVSTRDETPVEAVDELYQAVVRMRRKPEGEARRSFLDAAEDLGSDPPFGVDPAIWEGVLTDVDNLLDALTEDAPAVLTGNLIEALRRRLRPLI